MAKRNVLHISKLEDLKKWLVKDGWDLLPLSNNPYEVLRASKAGKQNPLIIYSGKSSEHLSFADRDMPVIGAFIRDQKKAARIWLKVTNVRVERLQEITPKDAENEGVGNLFYEDIGYSEKNYGTEVDPEYGIAKEQFAWLWESTIKKSDLDRYGWDANPWVWVIEFERCEKPETKVN